MRTDADHLPRVRDPAVELLLSHAGQYDNDWSQPPAAQLVEDLAASVPAPSSDINLEVQHRADSKCCSSSLVQQPPSQALQLTGRLSPFRGLVGSWAK